MSEIDFNDVESLRKYGFSGFRTVGNLWADRSSIPKVRGVYLVLHPSMTAEFICPGVGGFFNGEDPNVPITVLYENYVPNSLVVYIGKAGKIGSDVTLYSRLSKYLSFGRGKRASHRGGRLIWQLKEHRNLVICWMPTPNNDPRKIEKFLIHEFTAQFGKRPFANLNT